MLFVYRMFLFQVSDVEKILGIVHTETIQVSAEAYDIALDISPGKNSVQLHKLYMNIAGLFQTFSQSCLQSRQGYSILNSVNSKGLHHALLFCCRWLVGLWNHASV